MNRLFTQVSICYILLFLIACKLPDRSPRTGVGQALPGVPREFRAAWVATVANINWPSKPGLPTDVQQDEAIKLLDLLSDHHFNAVIFQVRPQCDALYQSELEPWSYYLSGRQGQAPEPWYDPLTFWIDEAHKRGLELHVWLNPYRAHHTAGGPVTETSIVRKKSDLVVELKNGFWWLDPAKEETQDHSYQVAMDIVRRYDIDGVHFDDYFYPYPSYNNNEDFPDQKTYLEYRKKGGDLNLGDWRRKSVNDFIRRLYKGIKKEKKYVKFGISPFGIWRPGYPESIQGFDQYDQLYADAKLWLNKGWVDYFSPQLYWPINQLHQSFPVLLNWWVQENEKDRHLWPGINIGRLQGEKAIDESINEIMISRAMLKQSPGVIHWSIAPLMKNDSLVQQIFSRPYNQPALIPHARWLSKKLPVPPSIIKKGQVLEIESKSEFKLVIIYYRQQAIWRYKIIPCDHSEVDVALLESLSPESGSILISIVDRYGNESLPKRFNFQM